MPRPVQGFRIVKPHTERQSEAADAWGRCRSDNVTAILPSGIGLPEQSWWVGRTDEEFTAEARREQKRMEISKFGRTIGSNDLL